MKNTLLFLAVFFCVGQLAAQPLNGSAYSQLISAGEKAMEENNWKFALDKYEEAYDEKKDKDLLPMLADLRLKIRDYAGAARHYSSALRNDKKKGELESLRYNYGLCLKMTEKYDDALEEFQKYLATNPDSKMRTLTENQINGIEMAKAYQEDNKDEFKPKRLGKEINKKDTEYNPVYGRDGSMYYSTFNNEEVIVLEEGPNANYAKIFRSTPGKKGWEEPVELDVKINRPGYHSTNASFSKDGRRMYFTRQRLESNMITESKIYFAEGSDDNWGAANECVGVNGEWMAKHPAVGELFGREVLFFVADIDGGYGGDDLYYATYKDDGVYGDPVNLGPSINSPGDEITPYYIDGTLYFSSNGHPGFGGYDIFYTVWDGSRWSAPENLGGRYNSAQDEQYFSLDKDGFKGFFTSNRPGGGARSIEARTCCDDVYGFEMEQIEASLVVGLFTAGDKQPLPGGTVVLKNVVLNKRNSQVQPEVNRFDFPLELEMSYEIEATREGYYPASEAVSTVDLSETQEFVRRLYLEKIPPPTEVTVYDTITVYDTVTIEKAFVLENILYDFNDDKIKPEAEPDLQILLDLLNDTEGLVIELSSHTDYRGDDPYNARLSQRRANSAKRWLVQRGISNGRVVAKGYGESLPQTISTRIAERNDFLNQGDVLAPAFIDSLASEEQMEAAHQINRRTEFKILEGPTFIPVPRTEIKSRTILVPPPDRKSNIQGSTGQKDAPSIKIDERSSLFGQDNIDGLPVLVFKDRKIDFGSVKQGEKREHTFEFVNQGPVEAVIAVISSCDCTETFEDKKRIKPGESGKVRVVFDSTEKEEPELISIDMFLENKDKEGSPIIERFEYEFVIEK